MKHNSYLLENAWQMNEREKIGDQGIWGFLEEHPSKDVINKTKYFEMQGGNTHPGWKLVKNPVLQHRNEKNLSEETWNQAGRKAESQDW